MDVIFEPESGELYRPVSNDSMESAKSSLTNTGSFLIQNFPKARTNPILAEILNEDPTDKSKTLQLTQLKVDFKIETVNFKMSQLCKNSNEDEEIFNFILDEMKAELTMRTFDLTGTFNLGNLFFN